MTLPRAMVVAAALALAGCPQGNSGTLTVELTTAPGSPLLQSIVRLRVTLTEPRQVVETMRTDAGLDLAIDVDAHGEAGSLIVEGFDGSDALIATGQSPSFAVNPTTAHVVIYVAPPLTIEAAPVTLSSARGGVVTTPLAYGAALVGGATADAMPSSALEVYNAYDHSLAQGLAIPVAEPVLAAVTGSGGVVYVAQGHVLRSFNTAVAPAGAWAAVVDNELVTSTRGIVTVGANQFLVAADVPYLFEPPAVTARPELAIEPGAVATTLPSGAIVALAASGTQLARFHDGVLEPIVGAAAGTEPTFAALPNAAFLVATSDSLDLRKVDAATGTVTTVTGSLSALRVHPAIAATSRYVVVASDHTADILDATSLARVAVLAVHTGGFAIGLPNGQVLLGGDVAPNPVTATLELFTPPPPDLSAP